MSMIVISRNANSDILAIAVREEQLSEVLTRRDTLDKMSYLVRMRNGTSYIIPSSDATDTLIRLAKGQYIGN